MKCLQWAKEQVVLLREERRHCSRSGIKKLDSPVLCQGDPKPQDSAVEKLWSGCSVEDEGGAGGSHGRMEEEQERVLRGWRRSRGKSWEDGGDGGGSGESPGRMEEEQGRVLGGRRKWRRSRKRIQNRMFTQDSSHTDPQGKLATDKK